MELLPAAVLTGIGLALKFPEIFENDAKRALLPNFWHMGEFKKKKEKKNSIEK